MTRVVKWGSWPGPFAERPKCKPEQGGGGLGRKAEQCLH